MKPEKIKLNSLSVQSFVTENNHDTPARNISQGAKVCSWDSCVF